SIQHKLGGEMRLMYLVRFDWKIGLYFEAQIVIGDDEFETRKMKARSIRDTHIKLAHHCIAMTILGCRDSTNRITLSDLFFLYCNHSPNVYCNIPFWLDYYLNTANDGDLIYGGMYVTCLARTCRAQLQQLEQEEEEEDKMNKDG
nr:hypothetical protein [Tanacetum cinerariifolium]